VDSNRTRSCPIGTRDPAIRAVLVCAIEGKLLAARAYASTGLEVAIQAELDKRVLLTDPNARFMTTRDSHAGKRRHICKATKADRDRSCVPAADVEALMAETLGKLPPDRTASPDLRREPISRVV
jgi:hypothetical protein